MLFQDIMITAFSIFLTSFCVSFYLYKKIIYVSHKKHLFDEPSEARKIHKTRTPNLGGVGLFIGSFLSLLFFANEFSILRQNYIVLGLLITFLLGLLDDLVGMNPVKKLGGQFIVAVLLVLPGGIQITSLYGLFGIEEIPDVFGILCSVLFILVLINAYNLIDGINYLTSLIGIFSSLLFATFFLYAGDVSYAWIALAIAGSLIAFIYFNRTPARLFLGDSGSMMIGLLMALFSIHCLEGGASGEWPLLISSIPFPALVTAIVIVPVFDTFRVFYLRLSKRTSPFIADRNHIHHKLLDMGFNHLQSALILLVVTIVAVAIVLLAKDMRTEGIIGLLILYAFFLNGVMQLYLNRRKSSFKYISIGNERIFRNTNEADSPVIPRNGRIVLYKRSLELQDSAPIDY